MLIKRVMKNEMLPPWYGVAWREDYDNIAVCFPVPLNLLFVVGRAVWVFARYGAMSLPSSPREAYRRGWNDAKEDMLARERRPRDSETSRESPYVDIRQLRS
jgi:hypothetical protein